MSANNQLLIQKLGKKYSVSDVDVEGSGGFFITGSHFDTLEEAIKAANNYMEDGNVVEYGVKISI